MRSISIIRSILTCLLLLPTTSFGSGADSDLCSGLRDDTNALSKDAELKDEEIKSSLCKVTQNLPNEISDCVSAHLDLKKTAILYQIERDKFCDAQNKFKDDCSANTACLETAGFNAQTAAAQEIKIAALLKEGGEKRKKAASSAKRTVEMLEANLSTLNRMFSHAGPAPLKAMQQASAKGQKRQSRQSIVSGKPKASRGRTAPPKSTRSPKKTQLPVSERSYFNDDSKPADLSNISGDADMAELPDSGSGVQNSGGATNGGMGNGNQANYGGNAYDSGQLSDIRAADLGVANLDEYRLRLPAAIREQKALAQRVEKFEKVSVEKTQQHSASAAELGSMAIKIFASAKKLQTVPASDSSSSLETASPELEKKLPVKESFRASNSYDPEAAQEMPVNRTEDTRQGARAAASEKLTASQVKFNQDTPPESAENSEEDQGTTREAEALAPFETAIPFSKGNHLSPSSLREALRKQMENAKLKDQNGKPSVGETKEGIFTSLMNEQREASRDPSSEIESPVHSLTAASADVESALRDMEGQLEEMNRSAGILEAESENLFQRVKKTHTRFSKKFRG